MLKKIRTTASVLALTLAALPLAAQTADTVVATVGETEITLGEMIIIRAGLPQQYSQFPDDVLFEGILDQLIQQQLLADTAGDAPARVEYALRNERRSLLAGEIVNEIAVGAVTEEAVAEAYANATGSAEPITEWNASHLLVATEEEAAAARARVEGGEDFAEVAKEVSTGPSGPSGGELGWFGPGMMVGEFEEAVKTLEVGGLAGPVQTQFGWHIVKLNDSRVQEPPALEQMRPELEQQLQEAAIDARIEELRAEVEITMPEDGAIDPALISNLELLEPAAE